jgi:hypothetical protein
MKILKKRTLASLIASLLMLTIAISIAIPTINAQTVRTTPTKIYVTAQPIGGVGQSMFLIYWTEAIPPDIGEQTGAVAAPGGRAGWYGVKLTVTTPNGTQKVGHYTDPWWLHHTNHKSAALQPTCNMENTFPYHRTSIAGSPETRSGMNPAHLDGRAPLPEITGNDQSRSEPFIFLLAGQWQTYTNQYPFGGSGGNATMHGKHQNHLYSMDKTYIHTAAL